MEINLYIPVLPIEIFTWLAIYIQFNIIIFFLCGGTTVTTRNDEPIKDIVKRLSMVSVILAPLLIVAVILDYKLVKLYLYRFWIETPEEERNRFDEDI